VLRVFAISWASVRVRVLACNGLHPRLDTVHRGCPFLLNEI
jgi:hypothetical protein